MGKIKFISNYKRLRRRWNIVFCECVKSNIIDWTEPIKSIIKNQNPKYFVLKRIKSSIGKGKNKIEDCMIEAYIEFEREYSRDSVTNMFEDRGVIVQKDTNVVCRLKPKATFEYEFYPIWEYRYGRIIVNVVDEENISYIKNMMKSSNNNKEKVEIFTYSKPKSVREEIMQLFSNKSVKKAKYVLSIHYIINKEKIQ